MKKCGNIFSLHKNFTVSARCGTFNPFRKYGILKMLHKNLLISDVFQNYYYFSITRAGRGKLPTNEAWGTSLGWKKMPFSGSNVFILLLFEFCDFNLGSAVFIYSNTQKYVCNIRFEKLLF
jgi:hypothetical protein